MGKLLINIHNPLGNVFIYFLCKSKRMQFRDNLMSDYELSENNQQNGYIGYNEARVAMK